ncbi:MAG: RNB domain-containing ribonuclease [Candidatus Riflebacteria bacterium]|nr:RNB domain-containing ribonuclease [Candidatus Riflebacteria bacterium]
MVVGFRDKKELALACVVEASADKVRLVTERGKQFSFPADKVLVATGTLVNPSQPQDALVAALAQVRLRVDELRAQVVLSDLWELLTGSEQGFPLARLTGDYFGAEAGGEHQAALLAELLNDSVYFKQKGDDYVLRSDEQVREIKRQLELEHRRTREREAAIAWFKGEMGESRERPAPEGIERFITLLKGHVLAVEGATEGPELATFMKEIGISDAAGAFDLLVRAGVWSIDENLLLHRYQVPDRFGREVLAREQELLARFASQDCLLGQPGRRDLTALEPVTIDDPETEDIDDALSLERIPGGFRVGIHIADVAEFVAESDPLDQEALRRALTIYLPDRKIQMLPDTVSVRVASLVAGEVHAALSVMVDLDETGAVLSYELTRSAIRVKSRLSYEQVDGQLGTHPDFAALLQLAELLKRRRIEAGALVFNVPDVKVRAAPDGRVTVSRTPNDTPAHLLVSEMMILANRLVAGWLLENRIPGIYRSQPPPDEPLTIQGYDPVTFYRVRRQIKRTETGTTARPHSGLGIPAYTQMTSPIRRYSDLVIHRQIRGVLDGRPPCYTEDDVRSIVNATERVQEIVGLVQKEAHRYWLLKYLKNLVGLTVPGLILDRRDDSYVVQLSDYLLEVTVYMRQENRYEVGDAMQVTIIEADPRRGYVKCLDAGRPQLPTEPTELSW